jgi:hypothetical protein
MILTSQDESYFYHEEHEGVEKKYTKGEPPWDEG